MINDEFVSWAINLYAHDKKIIDEWKQSNDITERLLATAIFEVMEGKA